MEVFITDTRRRFGRDTSYFVETEVHDVEYVERDPTIFVDYVDVNPSSIELDTSVEMSVHTVNTRVIRTEVCNMTHREGGWPKDIDPDENQDVKRYRKKVEKAEVYRSDIVRVSDVVENAAQQNNTVDIYEDYFSGSRADHSSEPPSAKGLAVFRDPCGVQRSATSIDWQPDSNKLAVAYSVLNFQDPRFLDDKTTLPMSAYVWDSANPNTPELELLPSSPLVSLKYNPKFPDQLVGGSYNGLVTFFDTRKGTKPIETSVIENSHHDPVYDIHWVSSKEGKLCVSVSTDGQMLWWDTRRLGEPLESLKLGTGKTAVTPEFSDTVLGGSSLEYNNEAGATKFLVGTEQGVVLGVNTRNKKSNNGVTVYDTASGKHHGPIYSIQRNPLHTKYFLTVGDWSARVWMEDLKTPIIATRYHSAYLTGGCWSPTRPGVFYVTRDDGVLDIWDYFYRQNEVAYSHKVSDAPLTSIAVHSNGKLVAVGDSHGTVSLLEVCDSLSVPQSNEKAAIYSMFEREMRREKNLEARAKELKRNSQRLKAKQTQEQEVNENLDSEAMQQLLLKVDKEFLEMIKASDGETKS